MCTEELGANIFRITQTEVLLKKRNSKWDGCIKYSYKVGKAVRDTIKKLGCTMPEKLPTLDKSIKELINGDEDEK